jgi:hypothetical protein
VHRCAEHGSLRALEKITAKRERLTSKEWALDIDKGGVDVSYRMSKVLEVDRHSVDVFKHGSSSGDMGLQAFHASEHSRCCYQRYPQVAVTPRRLIVSLAALRVT